MKSSEGAEAWRDTAVAALEDSIEHWERMAAGGVGEKPTSPGFGEFPDGRHSHGWVRSGVAVDPTPQHGASPGFGEFPDGRHNHGWLA